MNNVQIRSKIEELADEKYREFQKKLCPKSSPIIGVRIPVLRNFAKELVKNENVEEYLNNALDNSYEEILLQGMVLGVWNTSIDKFCCYAEKFIPKIDSWAVCDVSVTGFKIINKNKEYIWKFIQKYLSSTREFELRFAIVVLLNFYIIPEYINEVLKILNSIKHEGYYVKMAIAWTLQKSFVKFPEETMELLKCNKIDNWTYNKALQKILESYKVDEDTKNVIRKMKR